MTLDIRICQFFELKTAGGTRHRYQNYFAYQSVTYPASTGSNFDFAPFRAEGAMASLNGENTVLQVLFPNIDFVVQLLGEGDGNRLSTLTLTTQWLTSEDSYTRNVQTEYYIGTGASISETTVELRFRSAIDSVSSNFPGRTLTQALVGPLPLDSQLYLQ
jgi:hypothetical protein